MWNPSGLSKPGCTGLVCIKSLEPWLEEDSPGLVKAEDEADEDEEEGDAPGNDVDDERKLALYLSTSAGDNQGWNVLGCHPGTCAGAESPSQGVIGTGGPDLGGCLEEMLETWGGRGWPRQEGIGANGAVCLATLTVGPWGLNLCCWMNLSSKDGLETIPVVGSVVVDTLCVDSVLLGDEGGDTIEIGDDNLSSSSDESLLIWIKYFYYWSFRCGSCCKFQDTEVLW